MSFENAGIIKVNFLMVFSVDLRSSTIFCMIQILISSRESVHFASVKARLVEIFKTLLMEHHSHVNDFKLKGEIINGITQAISELSTETLEFITTCLPAIGQIMFNCCIEYKSVLMGQKQAPMDPYENEPNNFYFLLHQILVFINSIFVEKSFSSFLTDGLNDFLYLLLILMAPHGTVEENLFSEEVEATPEIDFTLRGRCGHTLLVFMDQCNFEKFSSTFHYVLQKHINEANTARRESELYYNRINEALMYAVGLLTHIFEEPDQSFFQYVEHWSSMIMEFQANQNMWVMFKRLLWLGGRFSQYVTPVTLNNHLSALLTNYSPEDVFLKNVRLEALRAHLSCLEKNPNNYIFLNYLNEIMDCLFNIPIETCCKCMICLDSLAYFFQFSPDSAAVNRERIFQIILDSTLFHMCNYNVINKVKFALSRIVANPTCKDIVERDFIPFTMKLIYKSCFAQFNMRAEASEKGFDLLNIVIMFHPGTISDDVVVQSFLAGCNNIIEFEDSSVVEVATIFLSNLLIKSSYQIKTLSDSKGKVLAQYVTEVLFKLLEPYPQEAVCPSKFGRFCVISIMTLPEEIIEPCIEPILKALLSALQRTKEKEAIKSYCVIFAYMFMWQTENIINFLSGIPGPDGRSALSYFLNRWGFNMLICEKFEKSIITLAICKMIEYSLTKNDNRINDCRIQLERPYSNECMGLEKLYLCLVKILLYELDGENRSLEDKEEYDADILIKSQPICNFNLVDHIKSFINNYNTRHYYNIVKNYVEIYEPNAYELKKMELNPINC